MFYVFIDVLIFIYKRLWNEEKAGTGVNDTLHLLWRYGDAAESQGVNDF